MKVPSDPRWSTDLELKPYFEWLKEYIPAANATDTFDFAGWAFGQTLVQC
jgi:branched-chain amino acid transport system substrate-binding protein